MSPSNQIYDNLTVISGIADTTQQRLREFCGVRSYADLAALSAAEIVTGLRAAGQKIINQSRIEEWIREAGKLATAAPAPTITDAVSGPRDNDDTTVPHPGHQQTHKRHWKPFASFVVEFQEQAVAGAAPEYQTTIHHVETDSNERWPGIERTRHCQWMLNQLGDKVLSIAASPPPPPPPKKAPRLVPPVRVQVQHLRLLPLPATAVHMSPAPETFPDRIQAGRPFALEVTFALAGENAANLMQRQSPFTVQFYVYDWTAGTSRILGQIEQTLAPDSKTQTAMMSDIALEPGSYRIFTVVSLPSAAAVPGFAEISRFYVS